MKLHRSILLAALGAIALPVAAQQRTPAPPAQGNSIRPVAPPQTTPTPGPNDVVIVPNRQVGATLAGGLTTYQVDTRARRPISPECVYQATVQGTMRAPQRVSDDATIRDADLRTEASIVCQGRVVTTRSERLVLPTATARELSTNLEKGLSVSRPGQRCLYSVALRIDAGRMAPERAINVCKPGSDPLIDRPNLAVEPARLPGPLAEGARFGVH